MKYLIKFDNNGRRGETYVYEEKTSEEVQNLLDNGFEEVSEEDAEKFTEEITELYPDVDVDIQFGGQPIYYYVLAVE